MSCGRTFNTTVDIRLKQWADVQLPKRCVEVSAFFTVWYDQCLATKLSVCVCGGEGGRVSVFIVCCDHLEKTS